MWEAKTWFFSIIFFQVLHILSANCQLLFKLVGLGFHLALLTYLKQDRMLKDEMARSRLDDSYFSSSTSQSNRDCLFLSR